MIYSNKLKVIITLIIIILLGIGIFSIIRIPSKKEAHNLQIIKEDDVKYYVLRSNQKFGVIDNLGNTVIEANYAKVEIPNPTLDIFLCTDDISENAKYEVFNKSMEKLFQGVNVEPIRINALTSYVPYEKEVLKYKDGNYYGLISIKGEKITDPIYESISSIDYKEGYLKVMQTGSFGVIDITGKEIIKKEYDNIMSDGYYEEETKYEKSGFITRIKTDDGYRFGYNNSKGKVILDPIYNELSRITEIEDDKDVYLILASNGKYGLYKNSKPILDTEFTYMSYDKNSELIVVNKGDYQGIYNLEGKVIIPIDYDMLTIGGDYISAIKDNTKLVFDTKGNKLETDITNHTKVSDNYSIIIDDMNFYNIVDNSNKKLLNAEYIYLEYFKDDMFIATKETKTGVIKANGEIVVPIKYSSIQKIEKTNLLQALEIEEKRIDLISPEGQVLDGLENANIIKGENYIKIYSDTNMKYFNLNGETLTNRQIFTQNKLFADCKNGKWGFVDQNSSVVIDYIYEMTTEENKGVCGFKQNGKWGIINQDGKIIVEPIYKIETTTIPKFLGEYYEYYVGLNVPEYCLDVFEDEE